MSKAFQPDKPLPNNGEEKLLAFVEELILDLAKSHPAVTKRNVADWLAAVVVGRRRTRKVS